MMNFLLRREGFRTWTLLSVPALLAWSSTAALGANTITGTVFNQSRGEPAAGDDVTVVRLDTGMQEGARATTNARGAFALNVRYPDKTYLVRAFHQGVSYDQQAFAGDVLSIQVFDAAPHAWGVTCTTEILRAGTNGTSLHVSDLVEIKNESSPPLTQVGERNFEAYLPAGAKIDSVLAAGPGTIGEMISAAPVSGEPGHYTVNFPLRPGATKFAFNYDLPYDGHAVFQIRHAYPLQQFVVMIPLTIKFSSRSPAFKILATADRRYQLHLASQLRAGEGPGFELFGAGALPPLGDQAKSVPRPQPSTVLHAIISAPSRAASPSLPAIDSDSKQTQAHSQSIVLDGVISVLLVACALMVWRTYKARNFSAAQRVAPRARPGNRPQSGWKL